MIVRIANRYGVEPNKLVATLKATAFRGVELNDQQLMMLLLISDEYRLNPLLREIYGMPDKGGVIAIVGVDGWIKITNSHPQFNGLTFDYADDGSWCECVMYRRDREHAIAVREYLAECKRNTPAWTSHPRRMLRHRALVQTARVAFGFSGLVDPEEAEQIRAGRGQIIDGEIVDAKPSGIAAVKAAAKAKRDPPKVDPQTGEIVGSAAELDDETLSFNLYSEQISGATSHETASLALDEAGSVVSPATLSKLIDVFTAKWEAA